jgi:RNA polymerase sigma factor (sigma-70 family)
MNVATLLLHSSYEYMNVCNRNRTHQQSAMTMQELFSTLSHKRLVRLCSQSSSHPAWNEFYSRFDHYIRLYINKTLRNENINCGCKELGDDLSQEVYLRLIAEDRKALREFKGKADSSFLAYLSVICTNVVREHFRLQRAEKRNGKTLSIDLFLNPEEERHTDNKTILNYLSDLPKAIDAVAHRELSDLLDRAIAGPNSKRDKLIFKLYVVDGFSAFQIAGIGRLRAKPSTVESIIRRTRQKLVDASHKRTKRRLAA